MHQDSGSALDCVGRRLRTETFNDERAKYGKEILSAVSKELVAEFGRGFSWPNLSRMIALAEAFPDEPIAVTESRQLRSDFAFLARQKRINVETRIFTLLFYSSVVFPK